MQLRTARTTVSDSVLPYLVRNTHIVSIVCYINNHSIYRCIDLGAEVVVLRCNLRPSSLRVLHKSLSETVKVNLLGRLACRRVGAGGSLQLHGVHAVLGHELGHENVAKRTAPLESLQRADLFFQVLPDVLLSHELF